MLGITGAPRRPEIDQYAIKLLIGAGAFSLPVIELALACLTGESIDSISASYLHDPWPRNIFVGFLFAIGAFMTTYNGDSEKQMWLAKLGALAAFCLALFPCHCTDGKQEIVPYVHLIATIVMFAVLTAFCFIFSGKARDKLKKDKTHRQAKWRAYIYIGCASAMVVSIALFLVFVVANFLHARGLGAEANHSILNGLVLVGETLGLLAFGIAWVTASRVLPGITRPTERNELFGLRHSKTGDGPGSSSAA